MKNYLEKPELYIFHFGILVFLFGIFELVMLLVTQNLAFGGGFVISLIIGLRIIALDSNVFNYIRKIVLFLIPLGIGGTIAALHSYFWVLVSMSEILDKSTYLIVFPFKYLAFTLTSLIVGFIVWKKESIDHFKEPYKHETLIFKIQVICISKTQLQIMAGASVVIAILFLGPFIYTNPIKPILENSIDSEIIVNSTGSVNKIKITRIGVNGLKFRSTIEVHGKQNEQFKAVYSYPDQNVQYEVKKSIPY